MTPWLRHACLACLALMFHKMREKRWTENVDWDLFSLLKGSANFVERKTKIYTYYELQVRYLSSINSWLSTLVLKEDKMKSKTKTKDFTSPRKKQWEIRNFCQKKWDKNFLKCCADRKLKRGSQKRYKNSETLSTWLI